MPQLPQVNSDHTTATTNQCWSVTLLPQVNSDSSDSFHCFHKSILIHTTATTSQCWSIPLLPQVNFDPYHWYRKPMLICTTATLSVNLLKVKVCPACWRRAGDQFHLLAPPPWPRPLYPASITLEVRSWFFYSAQFLVATSPNLLGQDWITILIVDRGIKICFKEGG